jgi:phosphoribosylformylglycinamidine synthase subunit PurS
MTRFRVAVHIVPRKGVLDPQGKAVADALHALGFGAVRDARVGRHLVLDVDAADAGAAELSVRGMCDKLLANPVTEDYEIAAVTGGAS